MTLWHSLLRETVGAWRSMRYDLDNHRAAKLAGAFTEEFGASARAHSERSRLVPLTGVALLLAGGAAGAFLAISGGIAAIGTDAPPPRADRPAITITQEAAAQPVTAGPGGAAPANPQRLGTRRSPAPSAPAAPAASNPPPVGAPVTEASTLPPTSSPAPAPTSPGPSATPSTSTGESGSHPAGDGR